MTERLIPFLAAIAILSTSSVIFAQETDQTPGEEFFVTGAWSDPSECNQNVARAVSFDTLMADYKTLRGECVQVEGYWKGRALFRSTQPAGARRSVISDHLRSKRIGLYAQWEKVGEPPERPTRTTFVGRVGDCETQWPGATMVMGYCHYTGGPILLVSEALSR